MRGSPTLKNIWLLPHTAFVEVQSQLQVVFESSLALWERYVVDRCFTTYQTAICNSIGLYALIVSVQNLIDLTFTDVLAVHQPSSALIQTLMMLIDDVQSLGLPFVSAEFEKLLQHFLVDF